MCNVPLDPENDHPRALQAAASPSGGWQDAPAVCNMSVKLGRAVSLPWSSARQWLFHSGFRPMARVWMLAQIRRDTVASFTAPTAPVSAAKLALRQLPAQLWYLVLKFSRRRS